MKTAGSEGVVVETFRALVQPRRLGAVLVVSVPLVWAQTSYSHDLRALPLGLAMCVACVGLAPLTWRVLLGGAFSTGEMLLRVVLYGLMGSVVVFGLGDFIPWLMGMGQTFLTQGFNLLICVALYWVGGWGLARDMDMELRLRREEARAAGLAREAEQAQLMALRSHLDPHFLFNTLNAIAEWCREDGETAERAVLQLSSMLRAVLAGVKSVSWPLRKELELVQTLYALHLMRDPKMFRLVWEVPDGVLDTPVPPMILLPLAENSVKHGPAAGHRGDILVKVSTEGGGLRVEILNPGRYKGPREGSDGVPTVEKRLALAYAGKASLGLRAEGEGTLATVFLPPGGVS